jgi:hypothetical protein
MAKPKTIRASITMPLNLWAELNAAAVKAGMGVSAYVAQLLQGAAKKKAA